MANVIIKSKRELHLSLDTGKVAEKNADGSFKRDANGRLVPKADYMIAPDVSAVIDVATKIATVRPRYWDFDDVNNVVKEMTQAQKEVVDADAANLVPSQSAAYAAIDKRTGELITAGHTYNTKTYSLSENAQKKLIEWRIKADSGDETARTATTLDNTDTVVLVDAAAVIVFTDAAFSAIQVHLDSGDALRAQVRAATNISAVEAVDDNR